MTKTKDTLFHINWGDGDDTFVIAPDEKTARERMPDGKDMVNYVVRLDALYDMIYKAGIREVVEAIRMYDRNYDHNNWGDSKFRESLLQWVEGKLKE